MKIGDRVIVNVRGVFWRHTGVITRITVRRYRRRRVVYRVAIDHPPWERAVSADWGFDEKELELLEQERERG